MRKNVLKIMTVPVGVGLLALLNHKSNKSSGKKDIKGSHFSDVLIKGNQIVLENKSIRELITVFNQMTTLQRDQTFSNKNTEIIITDKINDASILTEPCVILGDYNSELSTADIKETIICIFTDSDKDKLLRLSRGDLVTIKGNLSSEGNRLRLINCKLVNKETN